MVIQKQNCRPKSLNPCIKLTGGLYELLGYSHHTEKNSRGINFCKITDCLLEKCFGNLICMNCVCDGTSFGGISFSVLFVLLLLCFGFLFACCCYFGLLLLFWFVVVVCSLLVLLFCCCFFVIIVVQLLLFFVFVVFLLLLFCFCCYSCCLFAQEHPNK